jgi:hypothetical protein
MHEFEVTLTFTRSDPGALTRIIVLERAKDVTEALRQLVDQITRSPDYPREDLIKATVTRVEPHDLAHGRASPG